MYVENEILPFGQCPPQIVGQTSLNAFLRPVITQDDLSDYFRQVGYAFLDRHVALSFYDIIQQCLDHFVVVGQAKMPLHNPGPFLEPDVDGEGILFAMSA